MSGYGHMAELSKRTKMLDALRKERLKNYKKRSTSYSALKIEFDFKKVSPEELRVIKQKIQEKFKKERLKNIVILFFSALIGFPLFWYIIISFLKLI